MVTKMNNEIFEIIKNRRTVREFNQKPITKDTIEKIIEAATWAPNHRSTEPWRFFVLEKNSEKRLEIANLIYDWTYSNVKNPNEQRKLSSAISARKEILDAPAFIYVYSIPGENSEITKENYAATCCAIQNLQLASYSIGIGVGWSTGKPCLCPEVKKALNITENWEIVGALYIGYIKTQISATRTPIEMVTKWL